jgi:hypothetical protein
VLTHETSRMGRACHPAHLKNAFRLEVGGSPTLLHLFSSPACGGSPIFIVTPTIPATGRPLHSIRVPHPTSHSPPHTSHSTMRAHFVLRSFLSVTVFLVVHSSARPTNSSTASEASGITWISPQADHVYHPGDLIHLQWFIGEGTNSPNYFGMCVGNEAVSESGGPQRPHSSAVDSAVEEETAAGLNAQLKPAPSSIARRSDQSSTCGDRIWAKPHHNGSVYSLMLCVRIFPVVISPFV